MIYKRRILTTKLQRMIQRFTVVIVSGSRQVGKSTLLRNELSGWDTVVFDPVVDVLLERDGTFYPMEVKLSSHPSRKDTRGIASFRANYPKLKIAPGLVIAPAERIAQLSENGYCLPWDAYESSRLCRERPLRPQINFLS